MIEVRELTKRFGVSTAVQSVSDHAHDHGTGPADVGTVTVNDKPYLATSP